MFLFATCVRSFPECRCKNTQNNRNRQEPSQKKYKKIVASLQSSYPGYSILSAISMQE